MVRYGNWLIGFELIFCVGSAAGEGKFCYCGGWVVDGSFFILCLGLRFVRIFFVLR